MNRKMSSLKLQTHYSIMVIPGVLWMILFNIVPMAGVVMAFKNYNPGLGLWKSPSVGLENFKYLFSMSDAQRVIINTLIIACSKVVLNIVIPLAFALLLNEVTNLKYKKFVQTAVYLPHFLSWVILASVILNIFSMDGIVNQITGLFGAKPVIWFSMASYFRQLVIGTDVWKEFGFNAVIFLAALTGINPNLYEAATIDGCSKWKSIWYITIPGIAGTIVLLGVLGLGNVLNAGFDQIYNLYNPMVYSTGDILDTWVYRIGLVNLQFSLATTAGLFKSAISFIMIVLSYWAAYKLADYKIF
ncbi:MAG: binding-protein-dependent transport system inner rane component [Eubacterium sp.]|nr:binding-protein-dependent transport system inner rane component [Eubacterium sp.]